MVLIKTFLHHRVEVETDETVTEGETFSFVTASRRLSTLAVAPHRYVADGKTASGVQAFVYRSHVVNSDSNQTASCCDASSTSSVDRLPPAPGESIAKRTEREADRRLEGRRDDFIHGWKTARCGRDARRHGDGEKTHVTQTLRVGSAKKTRKRASNKGTSTS